METLLLIEDDTALRENTAELLELSGYNVITAPNGKKGVEAALEHHPNLIICDIMMPELDGYGVLEQLTSQSETQFIPFIFLSAKTEHSEIRKGMDLGADDYLTKPFEEEELLSAIRSRLQKSNLMAAVFEEKEDAQKVHDINMLKNFFDDHGEILEFEDGEEIFHENEQSHRVYLVLKGIVKTFRVDNEGKELTTALVEADEFLGFSSFIDYMPYGENAIAVGSVSLSGILKSDVKNILLKNTEASIELLNVMSNNVSDLKQQLLQMAYSSVQRKTAQTLLHCASVMNPSKKESIRVTRHDLASMAGIATESLIRSLSALKKKKLIRIEGRNITILNEAGLQAIQ